MSSIQATCTIENCNDKVHQRSWCVRHYTRWRRHGNPLVIKRININHGRHGTTEYRIYYGMKNRCHNPNSHAFKDYGGRGITVCQRWLESFENFYADMGARPSKLHTVERKDNSLGYSPENCMWATWDVQSNNKRLKINAKSGFYGVYYENYDTEKPWRSKFFIAKKTYWVGRFADAEEAAIEYDKHVLFYRGNKAYTNYL